jgi:multisubunit Na+/H+ antiporter MnhG subunit
MNLPLTGTAGIGIVLGWLLGDLYGRVHNPPRTVLAVSVAALLTLADISYLAGSSAIIVLIAAISLPFVLHLLWRRQLYRSCGLPNKEHSGG